MLLSVLLQATAAAVGVSKLGAAIGAGLAVIGAGLGIGKIGGSAMEAKLQAFIPVSERKQRND